MTKEELVKLVSHVDQYTKLALDTTVQEILDDPEKSSDSFNLVVEHVGCMIESGDELLRAVGIMAKIGVHKVLEKLLEKSVEPHDEVV